MKSTNATYTGFQFEVEGFPALAIINKDLKQLPDRNSYRYSIFIDIIPDVYNEYGHPTGEELDRLSDLENDLIEYLENETITVHVGHTTLFRKREIIFYTKEPEKAEVFLEHFLSTTERQNGYEIEDDPDWENVAAFYEMI